MLELFNALNSGTWDNTYNKVSFRMEGTTLLLQCSREPMDWWRNILIIPVVVKIGWTWMVIPLGLYLDFLEIYETAKALGPERVAGYSTGADLAALLAVAFQIRGYSFGCPNFLLFPTNKTLEAFDGVQFIETDLDVVSKIPHVYRKGRKITKLKTNIDISFHAPDTYYKYLGGK